MDFKLTTFNNIVNVTRIANIHYFEFTTDYHTSPDRHDFCELVYVDKGSIMVNSEYYKGPLLNNQLIIHSPKEEHALTCNIENPPDVIIIGFECECSDLDIFAQKPVSLSPDLKKLLAEIIKNGMSFFLPPYDVPNTKEMKIRPEYPYAADQLIKLHLEEFLINLIRSTKTEGSFIDLSDNEENTISHIYQYITEHYHEKILLDNLCFLFATNKTTLCHDFKNQYGMTIFDYIKTLKINESKRLLRSNKYSVTEISEILGFTSVHYFCRTFKNVTGQSPKHYISTVKSKLDL